MLMGGNSNTYLQGKKNGGTDKELRGKGGRDKRGIVTATCGSKSRAECGRNAGPTSLNRDPDTSASWYWRTAAAVSTMIPDRLSL